MINKVLSKFGVVLTRNSSVHKLYQLKVVLNKHNVTTDCILDVGANVGQTIVNFHRVFKVKEYFAIEPFEEPFEKLSILCKEKYPKVKLFKLALSDKNEYLEVEKYSLNGSALNSLLPHLSGDGGKEKINCSRLDNFILINKIGTIDLLKIDVEGFEFQVLEGAGSSLAGVKAIYIEIGFYPQKRNILFEDMRNFLEERDFTFAGLFDVSNVQIKSKTHFGNALFLNSNLT